MKIEVTQEDIEQGWPSSTTHCPIALAVKRTLQREVEVYMASIVLSPASPYRQRIWVGEIKDFVRDYDAGWPVQPITFDLEIPS